MHNEKEKLFCVLFFYAAMCAPLFSQNFQVEGNVLVKYRGYIERADITIPDDLGITTIGDEAFAYSKIASVTIPASVSSIGERVFINCDYLTSIRVDKRNYAYSDSDGVLFDKNKTTLIWYPSNKKDASYIIPSSVTSIGNFAFFECKSLTGIIITAGVTTIGTDVFILCNNLEAITVDGRNSAYTDSEGVLFNKNMTSLVRFPANKKEISYVIPDGVNSIESHAFFMCAFLFAIVLPSSLNSIGEETFYNCANLIAIKIPDNVSSIGEAAFAHCYGLSRMILPSGITVIERGVFRGCENLTEISFPDNVTTIGVEAFYGCTGLTKITIPSNITSIEYGAFNKCDNLKTVVLPKNIKRGRNAFPAGVKFTYADKVPEFSFPQGILIGIKTFFAAVVEFFVGE